jgi:hypothetical protein
MEFQQYFLNGSWKVWRSPLIVTYKLGDLWVKVTENWNCPVTFSESVLYPIWRDSVKHFMELRENYFILK